ncbi:thioredoxin fold domain-containing protein [Chitinophaga sp. SYP-B3965]|uniref:thioredoxin family protein n=1 Tax=Chitinophaga sp. SYP-B3965 TaxID=2663120 RepID=UPI001299AB36|nr:thioredoxin family protein [Chitinophaga sp. SYP-B3965]MRG45832.1 thioredoxin fold domain-containing protein [Chitinophaga sp. SYP-B3965]
MTKVKIITCCLFFFFTLPALAQEDGIRFFEGRWKEVLAEAKKSGKLIFVDVYTNWSIPSQKMAAEIFPLKAVGDTYNANFINYQVNAEKGPGFSFAEKYFVNRYPTYLYINGDGFLVYKITGFTSPQRLLASVDSALHKQEVKETLTAYQEAFESRKTDKAFLRQYVNWLCMYKMPEDTISHVLDEYFSQLKPAELKDPVIATYLLNILTTIRSPVFDHIISHQPFYNTFFKQFPQTLGYVIVNSLAKAVETKNDPLFWEALSASKKLENPALLYPYTVFLLTNQYYVRNRQEKRVFERSPVLLDRVYLMKEEEIAHNDRRQFEELMYPYVSGEKDSLQVWDFPRQKEIWRTSYSRYLARVLSITADMYLQHTRNKTDLKKACLWAERAVELDEHNYLYYPVLSRLYAKTGMKREAIIAMQSAITLAQEQGASPLRIMVYKRILQDL